MSKYGWSSDYSAEIAETICDRLVYGESLRDICADRAMPAAKHGGHQSLGDKGACLLRSRHSNGSRAN